MGIPQGLAEYELETLRFEGGDVVVLGVDVPDHDVDVDDGFRGEVRDGGGADVEDGDEGPGGAERGGDEGGEDEVGAGPGGVVGDDIESGGDFAEGDAFDVGFVVGEVC